MNLRQLVEDATRRGRDDARAVVEGSAPPDQTPIGSFGAGGVGETAARRILHCLRIPPLALAVPAMLVRGRRGARVLALLERYAYWAGARSGLDRQTWRRLTRGTAILMYHAVGRPGEAGSRFIVPAKRFERQMRWLARRRLPVLALDDLVDARRDGRLPPAGAVVITFDDGFADTLDVAAPILRHVGFPATVFVVSRRVGTAADWPGADELSGRRLLGWDDVASLGPAGVTVGAHSRTHPQLSALAEQEAAEEIAGSRADLEAALGKPVRSFAYPFGRSTPQTTAAVGRAGFAAACGILRGLNDPSTPLLELRRAPIDGDSSMLRFALAVRFGDPDLLRRPLHRLREAALGAGRRRRASTRAQESAQ